MKLFLKINPVIGFVIIWLLLLLILPWRGFFLLNDSYVYEWNVRHFFENGFLLHPLTSPTTLFQTFLGSLVYIVKKDPSYLRLMTSIFYLLGVIYFYKTLILNKIRKRLSFLLSLLLMLNPLYLNLGFSFMTDIYFLSLFIISSYYYLLFLQNRATKSLVITSLVVTFSVLSRQTGIFISIAFILIYLYIKKRKKSIRHILILLIPVIVFILYQLFYPKPLAYTYQSISVTQGKLFLLGFYLEVLFRIIKTFYYFGFFVFPVTLGYVLYLVVKNKFFKAPSLLIFSSVFFVFTVFSIFFWIFQNELMFYVPNILSYAGFNPQNLGFGIKQTLFVDSPVRVRALITLISIASLGGLAIILHNSKIDIYKNKLFYILGVPSISILVISFVFRDYFDRYIIVVLPLILFILGNYLNKIRPKYYFYVPFLIVMFIVSVTFEHDYLSLNKYVWNLSQTISANQLDVKSTFEHNAYYRLSNIYTGKPPQYIFSKEWLPKNEDYKYIVSYTNVEPYCTIDKYYYPSFISPGFKGKLQLLKKCQ
ncbi:hypothetical protein COV24_02070 [candidate division WWE3 bacterium CG10_big_fil_rev_8_21_14_0_10_32_10]|uniref:Glycosyltransferase RgtA/B/C/D-like domain-containing protein n=1 Tax=candidate division WWE3 bacterium CG10_big_fil_rev_8_21_14_0_10_32_10 TaxID=1975090 RepID=A0A2H0RAN4_UNCKA|nr:MAG: hypothetical protein COV24_02070 [candidate division WWE3 bacterium CG10_big_fil_rev_8_21_14_0_10_32_10]